MSAVRRYREREQRVRCKNRCVRTKGETKHRACWMSLAGECRDRRWNRGVSRKETVAKMTRSFSGFSLFREPVTNLCFKDKRCYDKSFFTPSSFLFFFLFLTPTYPNISLWVLTFNLCVLFRLKKNQNSFSTMDNTPIPKHKRRL